MVPADAGRLAEVRGTPAQTEAGRVAHYLWWHEDQRDYADVAATLQTDFGYSALEIAWACRWGIPWAGYLVARGLSTGMNRGYRERLGRLGWGEVIAAVDRAGGCQLWELIVGVQTTHAPGLVRVLRTLYSLVPATADDVASALNFISRPMGVAAGMVKGSGLLVDSDLARRSMNEAGIPNSDDAVRAAWSEKPSRLVRDVSAAPENLAERMATTWRRASQDREDGIERLEQGARRDPSDPTKAIRDIGLLRDSLSAFSEAMDSFQEWVHAFKLAGKRWPAAGDLSSGSSAVLYLWATDLHRDAATASYHLGDLDAAVRLSDSAQELAELAGCDHKIGSAATNAAVYRMHRRSATLGDLDQSERLLELAAIGYTRAGVVSKLQRVEANRRHLRDAREGKPMSLPEVGFRAMPPVPAHGYVKIDASASLARYRSDAG